MSTSSPYPHVLVVGAGLGGLVFAQALRKKGISVEIFERDAHFDARSQGWTIILHRILPDLLESLPDDLGDIGVSNHLLPLDLPAQFKIFLDNEQVFSITSSEKNYLLRANRTRLREYLMSKLDIKWNANITRIEEVDNEVRLHFADGYSATGDVLVGADGVKSKVRKHLYNGEGKLRRVPVGSIVGQPKLNKEQYERQMRLGHSANMSLRTDDPHTLFSALRHVDPDKEHAQYYWMHAWPDADAEKGDHWTEHASQQELYDYTVKSITKHSPELQRVIIDTKPEDIMLPPLLLRDLDLGDTMPNRRITLLGDAAHAMTPNRGEGGNQAMLDALNLARTLAKSTSETLLQDLRKYQDEMLQRGGEAMRKSRAAALGDLEVQLEGWASWAAKAAG